MTKQHHHPYKIYSGILPNATLGCEGNTPLNPCITVPQMLFLRTKKNLWTSMITLSLPAEFQSNSKLFLLRSFCWKIPPITVNGPATEPITSDMKLYWRCTQVHTQLFRWADGRKFHLPIIDVQQAFISPLFLHYFSSHLDLHDQAYYTLFRRSVLGIASEVYIKPKSAER